MLAQGDTLGVPGYIDLFGSFVYHHRSATGAFNGVVLRDQVAHNVGLDTYFVVEDTVAKHAEHDDCIAESKRL